MSGAPNVEGTISAMRGGALDFLSKPFSADLIAERLKKDAARPSASGQ